MREINTKPYSILLEPFGRNTAPAITLAALKALENYNDPILLVLSTPSPSSCSCYRSFQVSQQYEVRTRRLRHQSVKY